MPYVHCFSIANTHTIVIDFDPHGMIIIESPESNGNIDFRNCFNKKLCIYEFKHDTEPSRKKQPANQTKTEPYLWNKIFEPQTFLTLKCIEWLDKSKVFLGLHLSESFWLCFGYGEPKGLLYYCLFIWKE